MGVFRHAVDADHALAGRVEVTGRIVHATKRGMLLDDGAAQHWLPKRFCKVTEIKGGIVEVAMPQWLAKEKRYL